jgi:hypothetical protein
LLLLSFAAAAAAAAAVAAGSMCWVVLVGGCELSLLHQLVHA